jgi:hypothetical protein
MRTISERRALDEKYIKKNFNKAKVRKRRYRDYVTDLAALATNKGTEMNRLSKDSVYIGCPEGHHCEWCQSSTKKQLKRAQDKQREMIGDI